MKISSDLMNTEDLNIILLKLQLNQSRANLDVRDVRTRPFAVDLKLCWNQTEKYHNK